MDLELNEDQQALKEAVQAVLEKESPLQLPRSLHEGASADAAADLWSTMVELGWPALGVPEEDGGIGLSIVEVAIVAEELGRRCTPSHLLPTAAHFVPLMRECGTQSAAAANARVASGARAAIAVGGDDGNPDPLVTPLEATVTSAGFRLDGRAAFVAGARDAEIIAVVAATDSNLVVFNVDPKESGVVVTDMPTIDPTVTFGSVSFDGVELATDQVVSDDAAGAVERAMEEVWVAQAASLVGTCQWMFDAALEYAKERKQFGVAIGSFQALKHRFANMAIALERARACTQFAAVAIAEDDYRRRLAASMAKAAAGDCQELVVQDSLQLMGAVGFTWEHDLHMFQKRARVDASSFGSARWHRRRVAALLGLAPNHT